MHTIEPFFSWRHHYIACEDPRSPFYGRVYSEIEFTHAIYNYVIHPQWDLFGSTTLVSKILYANYEQQFAIIEFLGEWNDVLYNDIMYLKNNVIDPMIRQGIQKFILIGENVLNFHSGDDDYYLEWKEDIEPDGYVFALSFREHVIREFLQADLDEIICFPEFEDEIFNWRVYEPLQIKYKIERKLINS